MAYVFTFINKDTAMLNARVLVFVSCLVMINVVSAKRFETRCKLVRELLKIGMPNDMFLGQWVCLIEQVSKKETSTLKVTPSGKKFYGLYQIPKEWCREKKRGGLCNLTCEALLDEDIRDDTACALQIAKKHGFKYWSMWTTRCKNNTFVTTEIYKCPDLMRLTPERSLSSNSQYRSSPPRLRRSANTNRISKVPRFRRSRHIN